MFKKVSSVEKRKYTISFNLTVLSEFPVHLLWLVLKLEMQTGKKLVC